MADTSAIREDLTGTLLSLQNFAKLFRISIHSPISSAKAIPSLMHTISEWGIHQRKAAASLAHQSERQHCSLKRYIKKLVEMELRMPGTGLEPARLAAPDPKSGASANFATPACLKMNGLRLHKTPDFASVQGAVQEIKPWVRRRADFIVC
jgi:hypothetical protein